MPGEAVLLAHMHSAMITLTIYFGQKTSAIMQVNITKVDAQAAIAMATSSTGANLLIMTVLTATSQRLRIPKKKQRLRVTK